MKNSDTCAACGHPKDDHLGGLGRCSCGKSIGNYCRCSRFIRLRWDKRQPAKVGTQPAMVRFRVHSNPSRRASWIGMVVEFKTEFDGQVHHGIVDRIASGVPFIDLQ